MVKTAQKLIPELRFPEFDGEWEKKKLGAIADRIGDGLHGTPNYVDDSEIFFINGNNLSDGIVVINEKTKKVDENTFLKNDKNLALNTLLISLNGTIGNVAKYNNENIMLGKSVGYFNFSRNSDFYYHSLISPKIQRFFIRELTGSTIKNLSLKTLRDTSLSIPSLPEQQKIASFLSAVDQKIQQLTQKKELLEQYKKGVMQQLFSQQLRFKKEDGTPYPDWEDMVLGECLKYLQPTKFLVSSTDYDDSYETPVLTAGKTFILGYTNEKHNICNQYPLIIFDDFTTASQFVDFPFKAKSSAMKLLIAKKGVDIKFMYESMQHIRFEVGGHGRHWISIFSNLVVSVPSIEEQQKIARYLSTIDTKIENVTNQITQTQTFKKGLLQQLFV